MRTVFKEKRDSLCFWKHAQAIVLGMALVFLSACDDRASTDPEATGSVQFKITEISTKPDKKGDIKTWLATYEQGSRIARFRIELKMAQPKGDMPSVFTSGAFYREATSDSELLLRAIAQALHAPNAPLSRDRIETLPFPAAILEYNLSRDAGTDIYAGSFTSDPPGTWIATKVFVAGGEGEFYLNLDPEEGRGEISLKDPDYGEIVFHELSKVL